jgi:hypothetical protein
MREAAFIIILIVVVVVVASLVPMIQPILDAQATRTAEDARHAALDNQAYEQVLKERETAAAGQAYATATAVANSAIATTVAISATRAANEQQASATAFAQQIVVTMTMTAVPFNAGIVETNANNIKIRDSIFSFALFGGAVIVGLLLLALRQVIIRESNTLHRDESGQLPAVIQGGQVVDPGRSVVPVTGMRQEDWLFTLWRIYQWARAGKLPDSQTTTVGNDVLTDPNQLVEAYRISIMPTTAAATFRPGQGEYERELRVKNAQQIAGGNVPLLGRPQTQVSAPSDSVTQLVLAMIRPQTELPPGERAPMLDGGPLAVIGPDQEEPK